MQSKQKRIGVSNQDAVAALSFDDEGRFSGERSYDFTGWTPTTYWQDIIRAFKYICRDKSGPRRSEYFYALLKLRQFTDEYGIRRYEEIDLREFRAFLEELKTKKGRKWRRNAVLKNYHPVVRVLKYLKRVLKVRWCQSVEIHTAPYGRTRRREFPVKTLTSAELLQIYVAACNEILMVRQQQKREDILAADLLPYIIAITCMTAANPEAVRKLSRDSLMKVGDNAREIVRWTKGRSSREQRLSYRADQDFQPPTLIREVEELTRRILPQARPEHRQYLFLCNRRKPQQRRVGHISGFLIDEALKSFIAKHNLPIFTLRSLRRSDASQIYVATGGDVNAVQTLLNQSSKNTTKVYLDNSIVAEFDDRVIAQAQQKMVTQWLSPTASINEVRKQLGIDEEGARRILLGKNATLSGITCKNPFEGIAPGQKVGQLCMHFLGCLTCENSLVTTDPLTLARLTKWRDHLVRARSNMMHERWDLLYLPIVTILERDILPYFPDQMQTEALALLPSLPDLPDIASR